MVVGCRADGTVLRGGRRHGNGVEGGERGRSTGGALDGGAQVANGFGGLQGDCVGGLLKHEVGANIQRLAIVPPVALLAKAHIIAADPMAEAVLFAGRLHAVYARKPVLANAAVFNASSVWAVAVVYTTRLRAIRA